MAGTMVFSATSDDIGAVRIWEIAFRLIHLDSNNWNVFSTFVTSHYLHPCTEYFTPA
jgi:hypothetical protein